MATNPMQRKARNSFLLGMLVMLLIAGAVIALLFMQLMQQSKKSKEEKGEMNKVYVLAQDVSSGQVITEDMLKQADIYSNSLPSNAIGDFSVIENCALQDKEGNDIYTKYDKDGKNPKLYIKKDGTESEVKKEEETENYYIEKNGDKEYLQLNSVPLIAKVTMKKNTIVTTELLSKSDNVVQDDVRKQEYNMVVLPMDLATGDYIDIRVMFPSGQDYIVVAKKEVEIPNINGVDSNDTIWVNLTEDEILHMSCAIIDAYQVKGAKIYATKYTDAGMQEAATATFPINKSTFQLLSSDPNILGKAKNEIVARYNETGGTTLRNDYINSEIDKQGEQTASNIESSMQESITNSKNSRKEYLDSLSAATTTSGSDTATSTNTSSTSK